MKYSNLESILDEDGIVFLQYGGGLSQKLISAMTDSLEKEVEHSGLGMKISSNIFTIFIELAQNAMNYGNRNRDLDDNFDIKSLILIGCKNDPGYYYIVSRNLVTANDHEVINSRLAELDGLDKDALRKLYRERRKSGRDKHAKGAGIGFVEIARRCDELEHTMVPNGSGQYYFTLKAKINLKEGS